MLVMCRFLREADNRTDGLHYTVLKIWAYETPHGDPFDGLQPASDGLQHHSTNLGHLPGVAGPVSKDGKLRKKP